MSCKVVREVAEQSERQPWAGVSCIQGEVEGGERLFLIQHRPFTKSSPPLAPSSSPSPSPSSVYLPPLSLSSPPSSSSPPADVPSQIAEKKLIQLFPKVAGHIDFADISTPLTINHYMRDPSGGAVGLDHTPPR
eukprot:763447-Hanusia_phi.AAC.3